MVVAYIREAWIRVPLVFLLAAVIVFGIAVMMVRARRRRR